MPDLPWVTVEERVQRYDELGILQWICHLRPTHPPSEDSEDIIFPMSVRKIFLIFLKNSKMTLLCRPDLIVGCGH